MMALSFNGESPTFDPKSNFPSSPSSSSMNNPSTTSASSMTSAPPQSAPAFSSHNIGPSSNPSALPASAPMGSSSAANIWSNIPSTPTTNQRRPSSYDIWSNNASNASNSIWSPNTQPVASENLGSTRSSFSANFSSPQQQSQQQEDPEYSSPPRMFEGGYEMNSNRAPQQVHSQQGPSQSQQQSQANAHYDFNLRRHSYSDVYSYNNNNNNNSNSNSHSSFAGSNVVANRGGSSSNFSFSEDPITNKSTLQLVNEYFESDPHERVKVTLKLLNERFFDEEKYLSDAYQLPKFPIENNLRNYQLILVGFKAGRIDVFYLPSSPSPELANLRVGDLVIVEADRGRDLGKVFKLNISIDEARLMKLLQFQEQQAALNENENIDGSLSVRNLSEHTSNNNVSPPTLHFPKSILSLAQPNEIIQILNKKQDEEKACRLCLAKIANATGVLTNTAANGNSNGNNNQSASAQDLLQMKLIDAEYQFDRKKLIFYYSTSKRIDFRDLVRELFRIYKTRIWMCAVIGLPYTVRKQSSTSPLMNSGSTSVFAHSQQQKQQQQQHQQAPQQQTPQQQAQQVPVATIPQSIKLNDPFSNNSNTNSNYINVNGGPQPYFNPDRRFSYQPQPVSTGQFPMHPPLGAPSSMGPSSFNMNNDLVQIPRRFLSEQKNLQPLYHQHPQSQSMPYAPQMMQQQQQQPPQTFQQSTMYGNNMYPMQGSCASSGGPPLSGFMPFRRDSGDLKEVAEEEDIDFPNRLNRGYGNGNSTDSTGGNSSSGESFVLKSLVDSINH